MMVELRMKDGSTKTGYHNGKTYGDSIYITPAGYRGGIKVALADIESMGELVTEAINKEETITNAEHITIRQRNNGLCPRCHTYCYGDCQV